MVTDEERRALASTVRGFLQDVAGEERTREVMATDDGVDEPAWRRMAEEVGLQGLTIPESLGGSGYGFDELSVVLEEMGRANICAPYFSTVAMGVALLMEIGDEEAMAAWLPGVAAGTVRLTVAGDGSWVPGAGAAVVAKSPGAKEARLDGEAPFVLDGQSAHVVLVPVADGADWSVFAVESDAAGLERFVLPTLDATRKAARLEFRDVPARLVGKPGQALSAVTRARETAMACLAFEQLGGMARCLEMTLEYARLRQQFGRPIGSFQAVKHRCADMVVEVEAARHAADWGSWALRAEDDVDRRLGTTLAKAVCAERFLHVAESAIQVHGGIGFTWEYPAHLYLRRARAGEALFGRPETLRAEVAAAALA